MRKTLLLALLCLVIPWAANAFTVDGKVISAWDGKAVSAWNGTTTGSAPTLVSATIPSAGTTLVLVFSVAVDYGSADTIALSVAGNYVLATGPITGDGTNTITYTISGPAIASGATVTISQIGGAGNFVSSGGSYLPYTTNVSVTNNSTATATPVYVQHRDANMAEQSGTGTTIRSVRLANPVLSGNCLIVAATWSGTATNTISDDKSNSYGSPTITYYDATNTQTHALWVKPNITNGPRKITGTLSVASNWTAFKITEFYNVASASPVDASTSNVVAGTSLTAGSMTPSQTGDLIYMVGWQDSATALSQRMTAGTGFSLVPGSTNSYDGSYAQYRVYASTSPINPACTVTGDPENYINMAVALKAASAGTAPAAGIRVIAIQSMFVGSGTTSSVTQFVTKGNLQILMATAGAISGIASTGANTAAWTSRVAAQDDDAGQMYYASILDSANTTAGSNVITVSLDAQNNQDYLLFDVTGAATVPYDKSSKLENQTQASGTTFTTSSVTPATSNGLVFNVVSVGVGTVTDPTSSSYYGVSATEDDGYFDLSQSDENNGWGIYYNPNTSAVQFIWNELDGPLGAWSSATAAYKAP